jgi:hypothetical protein
MSATVFGFESTDTVRMICECGSMDGKLELAQFGMRIFFKCDDCQTFVLMEVTK